MTSLRNLYKFKNTLMARSTDMSVGEIENEQTSFFGNAFAGATYAASVNVETLVTV